MTVLKASLIIVAATMLGGVAGAGVGYALGKYTPSYYETVFGRRSSHRPPLPPEDREAERNAPPWQRQNLTVEFYPEEVGFGLGLTQGMGAGLAIGGLIVACVTWANWRKLAPPPEG